MPNKHNIAQDQNRASKKRRILEAIQILKESDFSDLIEKNPQTLSSFNIFEKAKLIFYLKKYPDNKTRKNIFNTFYYMTQPAKMIRTSSAEFIQYCNSKLLPPNKISDHESWLKILNTALKSCSNKLIKNQLLGLMGQIEMSRHNLDLAKKYYLSMTPSQGVVSANNAYVSASNAYFLAMEANKEGNELEKLKSQKRRLEHLYAARENEEAVVLLRGEASVKQRDEKINDGVFLNVEKSWSKADEAAYQHTLEELEHRIETLKKQQLELDILTKQNRDGNTILLLVVMSKDPRRFHTLIETTSAAALNIALPLKNQEGYTALHYAAKNNDPEMFKTLVEKASPATLNNMLSMQDQDGHSLLSCAVMNKDPIFFQTLVEKVSTDALNKALTVKNQSHFDHHYGFTALHWALWNPDKIILQTLVEKASPAVLNKIFSSQIFFLKSFLENAARVLKNKDPSTFAALIEKAPQGLAFLNESEKESLKEILKSFPDNKIRENILNTVHYMTELEKSVRNSPAELMQFLNSKILPPHSIGDHDLWLTILNKTLKTASNQADEVTKNQLHGLMAYIEMSRNNAPSAKKYCLAITSPEGLPPAINLLVADFVLSEGRGLEDSKKNTALLKLQHEKKHLEHLHLAVISENKVEPPNENSEQRELQLKSADSAKDFLRIMLKDPEQKRSLDEEKINAEALILEEPASLEDRWNESDEAAYNKKMNELDQKIKQAESKKFKIPSWSLFGKSKKDDDKKQKIEAAIAVTAPPKAGSKK